MLLINLVRSFLYLFILHTPPIASFTVHRKWSFMQDLNILFRYLLINLLLVIIWRRFVMRIIKKLGFFLVINFLCQFKGVKCVRIGPLSEIISQQTQPSVVLIWHLFDILIYLNLIECFWLQANIYGSVWTTTHKTGIILKALHGQISWL